MKENTAIEDLCLVITEHLPRHTADCYQHSVHPNNWACDCKMQELKTYIRNKYSPFDKEEKKK